MSRKKGDDHPPDDPHGSGPQPDRARGNAVVLSFALAFGANPLGMKRIAGSVMVSAASSAERSACSWCERALCL